MASSGTVPHSQRSPEKAAKEQDFSQVARFEEPDGTVGMITQKITPEGVRYTWKLHKEYVAKGERERSVTNFFNPKHVDSARRILDKIEAEFSRLGVR